MEQQTCDAVHGDAEDTPFRADRVSAQPRRSNRMRNRTFATVFILSIVLRLSNSAI